jgi:lipopolysaccharide heptosyltransferase I
VNVLFVRLSSIGDVVHTLPALAAIHARGWEAGWIVEPAARPLLDGHPWLSQVVTAPAARGFRMGEGRAALAALRGHGYDLALDFQGLWKSAAWARLSGARHVLGYDRRGRREPASALLLTESTPLPSTVTHVIDKNLALLAPLDIHAVGLREFPFPFAPNAVLRVDADLAGLGPGDFAVLNPGGGWASKLWPAEGFGELARGLRDRGLRSLVTWGPGEEALADRVVEAARGAAARCFPTTLPELVELLRRARLVVAADTGPLHIACAVGRPVVALFGPTDPARNGPFAADDVVVRRVPRCAPCYRRGCSVHAGVMREIPAAEVLAAIDRRLGRSAGMKRLAL